MQTTTTESSATVVNQLDSLGTHDGKDVQVFEIKNDIITMKVTSFGASILSLKYKGKEMTLQHYDCLQDLINCQKNPKYGATCGRVAGRISNAQFDLNGQTYKLEANNGPNSLHGGSKGFDQQVWSAQQFKEESEDLLGAEGVEFNYVSQHLDQGFPGKLQVTSKYSLLNNKLLMKWSAKLIDDNTEIQTPINLTNHTYWNLSGDFAHSKISDHVLRINAQEVIEFNQTQTPTGKTIAVRDTPFDFICDSIIKDKDRLTGAIDGGGMPGIDHAYIINADSNGAGGDLIQVATLQCPGGVKMNVTSNQPCLVVYTANYIPESETRHTMHGAICLETMDFPDAVNMHGKANYQKQPPLLQSNQEYTKITVHCFED